MRPPPGRRRRGREEEGEERAAGGEEEEGEERSGKSRGGVEGEERGRSRGGVEEEAADEALAEEHARLLHEAAIDEATLAAAAVHIFATCHDAQVVALKAAYRERYRATVDSLLSRRLSGPIHCQLRDLVVARCGFIRHRPNAAAASTSFGELLAERAEEARRGGEEDGGGDGTSTRTEAIRSALVGHDDAEEGTGAEGEAATEEGRRRVVAVRE